MIYFDHAASAEILPQIRSEYLNILDGYSGNPESAHRMGRDLRKKLESLEKHLFGALLPQVPEHEQTLLFASDTTALLNAVGSVCGGAKRRVCGSALDHASVRAMCRRAFEFCDGFGLDRAGCITDIPDNAPDLVIVTAVQSEIGVRQDLQKIIPAVRKKFPEAVILLDAVQSTPFYAYPADVPLVDLMLISGSKLGSGSGAALLGMGPRAKFFQKKFAELRSREYLLGRVDAVQAAALTQAVGHTAGKRAENLLQVQKINAMLRNELADMRLPNGEKVILTVPEEAGAENILHLLLPGYQAGVLVRMFAAADIMLSSGSACESESGEPSAVLTALGYNRKLAYSGLRLSFSGNNSCKEAEIFLQTLKNILQDY